MRKKILLFLCCVFVLVFAFIPVNSVFAQSFTYNATLSEENSSIGNYAIEDVQEFSYFGISKFVVRYSFNAFVFFIRLHYSNNVIPNTDINKCTISLQDVTFNSNDFYFLDSIEITRVSGRLELYHEGSGSSYQNWINCYANTVIDVTYNFYTSHNYHITDSNILSGFVDMVADNNQVPLMEKKGLLGALYDFYFGTSITTSFIGNNTQSSLMSFSYTNTSGNTSYVTPSGYLGSLNLGNVYGKCTQSVSSAIIRPYNYAFYVYRPVYRVNNSLILYNYDYKYLAYAGTVRYDLLKGQDTYIISWLDSNASVPNSKFLTFYNNDIQNMVFDSYIWVRFNIGGFNDTSYNNYIMNSLSVSDGVFYCNLGYDFNFVYYAEPLVSSNGSYNYTYSKPSYVDVPGLLINPGGFVLAAVENLFIFLMFYCPIVSDVISFIHFDVLFGGLLSIINYILGLQIGSFIFSCIAFILFFTFVRMFMPVFFSSAVETNSSLYENSYLKYSRDKKKLRRYERKQAVKMKRYEKQVIDSAIKKRNKLNKKN